MKDKEKLDKERRRNRQRVLTQGDKLNYIKVNIRDLNPPKKSADSDYGFLRGYLALRIWMPIFFSKYIFEF